ncbi:hypothetical protein J1614_004464 [Plenodomus biglobosus]|nr:hypothetical protein J1614_004464 [Plenodomus biglobosus]
MRTNRKEGPPPRSFTYPERRSPSPCGLRVPCQPPCEVGQPTIYRRCPSQAFFCIFETPGHVVAQNSSDNPTSDNGESVESSACKQWLNLQSSSLLATPDAIRQGIDSHFRPASRRSKRSKQQSHQTHPEKRLINKCAEAKATITPHIALVRAIHTFNTSPILAGQYSACASVLSA